MSDAEARGHFRVFFEKAESEFRALGVSAPRPLDGERMLEQESSDEATFLYLAKRRKEGVTDEDVRGWWNLHDIERRILVQAEEKHRFGLLIHHIKGGMSEAEATARVRREVPVYGDPDAESSGEPDDRPLPDELRDRVERFREEAYADDPGGFVRETEAATSMNALVRKAMRDGRL